MTYFTASSLGRVMACPGSAALPQANSSGKAALTGIEGHLVLDNFIADVRSGIDYDQALAKIDPKWQDLCAAIPREYVGRFMTEVAYAIDVGSGEARLLGHHLNRDYRLEGFEVAGTADLVAVLPDRVIVPDVKTGWGQTGLPAVNPQTSFLALCAARVYQRDRATVGILSAPEGASANWAWADLDIWDLDATFADLQETYRRASLERSKVQAGKAPDVAEGPHCKYCPAMVACPVKTGLIRRLAEGSEFREEAQLVPLTRKNAGLAWTRVLMAEQMVASIKKACLAALDEWGEFELPSGNILRKERRPGKESLDGDLCYAIVEKLVDRELADQIAEREVTKKRLGEVLRTKYGRAGAQKEKEILDLLRKQGGIKRAMTDKLIEIDPLDQTGEAA
jgi:hypothetical protein